MTVEKPPESALTASNPPLAQRCEGLLQGEIRLIVNNGHYQRRVLLRPRCASRAAWAPSCQRRAKAA